MNLGIYGSGDLGYGVLTLLKECPNIRKEWDEIIFIDDTVDEDERWGCKRLSFENFQRNYSPEQVKVVIAVGEPKDREMLFIRVKDAGYSLATLVHEEAFVTATAVLGEGVVVQEGVRVSVQSVIGKNVFINHRSMIGDNTRVGNHCQICANVMLEGNIQMGDAVFAGDSVSIKNRTTIGEHSILSAGSVVLKDVQPYTVMMGNPAREISKNTDEKAFKA